MQDITAGDPVEFAMYGSYAAIAYRDASLR